jgi:hypothetical protein
LNKQNNYLENHHNIVVNAIPTHAMEHCLTDRDGKTWNTLKDAILSVNGVTHVHACKRTLDLGKWNISTNIDEWARVKTWLDVNLNKLFRRIPVSTRNKYPEYDDFAKPTRLHANRFGTNGSRPDDRNQDAYAQLVQASILGDDTLKIPTCAQAPAWKTTPCLVYTLDDNGAFPPFGKEKSTDEQSTGSNATTTSLTNNTDDILKQMETQWKTDKEALVITLQASTNANLTAMDSKIDSVIATLNTTMQTTIKTYMTTMEAKLNDTITDQFAQQSGSIVNKVVASMTGNKAPFVTAAGMQLVMENVMDNINKCLDKLTIVPKDSDHIKSPPRKHHKIGADIPMDTQPSIHLTDSSAKAGIAGHKN